MFPKFLELLRKYWKKKNLLLLWVGNQKNMLAKIDFLEISLEQRDKQLKQKENE
jgi:hypothetical protein